MADGLTDKGYCQCCGGIGRARRASAPFTKAKLRRAIQVAHETGSRVLARPDGTLVFEKEVDPRGDDKSLDRDGEIVL
jgi:hypothetical protein